VIARGGEAGSRRLSLILLYDRYLAPSFGGDLVPHDAIVRRDYELGLAAVSSAPSQQEGRDDEEQ
jgi:hypothetical protein